MTNEHHDTVVVDDGGSGSGMGAILGIIAIVVLLAAVWCFALGPGCRLDGTTNNNTINNGGNARPRRPPSSLAGSRRVLIARPMRRAADGSDRTSRRRVRTVTIEQSDPRRCCVGTQPLVLVADDEPRITKLVSIALSEEGFRVVTATGGEDALAKAEEIRPDIVLLDIVMPDLDGIEVMRQLREQRPVPVILLTAKGATADKAKGLDLGADDYIAKPFHPDELAARVRAVIRRSTGVEPGAGVVAFDDVEIDLERRMVRRGGELVQLSRTEWLLLQHLATHPGKVVLHTELLTKVWGPEYRDDLQYLRVWISRVRRKLGAKPGEPGRIRTFQGIGYLLDVEGTAGGGADDAAEDAPRSATTRSRPMARRRQRSPEPPILARDHGARRRTGAVPCPARRRRSTRLRRRREPSLRCNAARWTAGRGAKPAEHAGLPPLRRLRMGGTQP